MKASRSIWFAALLSFSAFAATESLDSPYVVRGEQGLEALTVEAVDGVVSRRAASVSTRSRITIPAVGAAPSFKVSLRAPAQVAPATVSTRKDIPVFIAADTHGEYEILVELLRRHRIVDSALRWSFGRGQFVILGDVFDRGPNQTEILWLIYKLEGEAKSAGGAVHLVLGNHEAMILGGDQRYLNPKYARTVAVLGVASYSELFAPTSVLGQWLRTKPAVLKLNDLLCLHGGISREIVDRKLTLEQINGTIGDTLNARVAGPASIPDDANLLMGPLGPLWYRGYFADQADFPTATSADIDLILAHFGVTTILVGHTMVPTITPLYEGRVIAVQVYPHRDQATHASVAEGLVREHGSWYRARIDGQREVLR